MYETIKETIIKTLFEYEHTHSPYNMWKEPLVKIISSENEQFTSLKQVVSPSHLLPKDILSDAKSVISFFIPFQQEIVLSNIHGDSASKEWALAYIQTNEVIKIINDEIEMLMKNNGYSTGKIPATHNFDKELLISNWSHRHIAYIAGLGTLGIHNMLITKAGCCGRLGSIITAYECTEYEEVTDRTEKCLHKINGNCGLCQQQCAVQAYKDKKFDRKKCYEQCLRSYKYYQWLGPADVCGKCLVGLPCSMHDPSA